MNAVSNKTIPTRLIYFSPPSKIKYNDNKTRPNKILTILSADPTFAFKVLTPFLYLVWFQMNPIFLIGNPFI